MADPKPQPAAPIHLEDFIEAASRAALRAVDGHTVALNPQPLPPGATVATTRPGRIFIGIIAAPEAQIQ